MEAIAQEKLLAEIHSPHLADLPPGSMQPHRSWYPDRLNFFVVGFNTQKVKREELPATYEGFLDPKWKGRIGIEATDSEWMAALVRQWGEARGMDFFRKLAAMKPDVRKGHALQREHRVAQEEGRADRPRARAAGGCAAAGHRRRTQCTASGGGRALRGLRALARRPESV
jgi:iron(III) transport system substrate-binding protein